MKRGIVVVWLVTATCIVMLGANYVLNERAIAKYEKGTVTEKSFKKQGLIQPYVYYFNKGNVYFGEEKYTQAVECYKAALKKNPPKEKECKIRINLVLSNLAMISLENLSEEEREQVVVLLKDNISILTCKGCASEEREGGHDEEAQKLKNEIQDMIDQLLDNETPQSGDDEQQNPQDEPDKQEKKSYLQEVREKDLEKTYKELQNQSTIERNRDIEEAERLSDPNFFESYDGDCW